MNAEYQKQKQKLPSMFAHKEFVMVTEASRRDNKSTQTVTIK